jgi:hypothetical protein
MATTFEVVEVLAHNDEKCILRVRFAATGPVRQLVTLHEVHFLDLPQGRTHAEHVRVLVRQAAIGWAEATATKPARPDLRTPEEQA